MLRCANVTFSLLGGIPSKKNAKGIRRPKGRKLIVTTSVPFKNWHLKELSRVGRLQIPPFHAPVHIDYFVYPGDLWTGDLSNLIEGINDLFVEARVIPDDDKKLLTKIRPMVVYYDWENPRVEVQIIQCPRNTHTEAIAILTDIERVRAIAREKKVTQKSITDFYREVLTRPPDILDESEL